MQVYRENRKFIKSWLLHLLTIICIHSDNFKIGKFDSYYSIMNRTPHRRHTEYAMRTFLNENEFPCEQVPIEVDLKLNGAHFVYVK